MFPFIMAEYERFKSLRTEFDAVAEELKASEDWARRRALIDCARRIVSEGNESVRQVRALLKIAVLSSRPSGSLNKNRMARAFQGTTTTLSPVYVTALSAFSVNAPPVP
jgi:hypothetical protein